MSDATERPADADVPSPDGTPDRSARADADASATKDPDAGAGADGGTEVPFKDDIDADAWRRACAEDLAAEQARRRARHSERQPGSAAEELRKLAEAVAEKVSALQAPIAGTAVHGAVQQLIAQAKAAVEPVIERNPEVFDHLASAGTELLAAYRAAVAGQEQRWAQGSERSSSEHIDLD